MKTYLVFYTYYSENNWDKEIVNSNVRINYVQAEDSKDAENIVDAELGYDGAVIKVIGV